MVAVERDDDWWNDKDRSLNTVQLAIAHDDAKRSHGWYNDDFRGNKSVKRRRQTDDQTRAYHHHAQVDETLAFSKDKELRRPIPLQSRETNYPSITKHLQLGSERGWFNKLPDELISTLYFWLILSASYLSGM
ncbi:hypothetical protein FDECE_1503 [Fusarium decemcellulare]|nr:hypothetical protein FDECE_1503 [Fusarium decemcellulare]